MDYIVIPTKDKSETDFFMGLLKKMNKDATKLSPAKMEDRAFIAALKEAEVSGKGSLKNVKSHLDKVAKNKTLITQIEAGLADVVLIQAGKIKTKSLRAILSNK